MNIDDIDDLTEDFDQAPQAPPVQAPEESHRHALQISDFDPDDLEEVSPYQHLQETHGGLGQQALGLVEGGARGVSLGFSDYLGNQLSKVSPTFSQENRRKRIEANPGTEFLGNAAGGVGLLALTGGLSAPAEALAGTGLLGRVLGYGAEGAIFGAGNANSEYALGDDEALSGDKLRAHIGMGAALGGGLGVLSKGIEAAAPLFRKSKQLKETEGKLDARQDAKETPSFLDLPEQPGGPVIDVVAPKGRPFKSMADMKERLQTAGSEELFELPQKQIAETAAAAINPQMEFPITPLQLDSLSSEAERLRYRTQVEVPGGTHTETLQKLQAAQKYELIHILDDSIKDIAPGYKATTNARVGGNRVADALTKAVDQVKESLIPAFRQIRATPLNHTDHVSRMIDYLTNPNTSPRGNPELINMFDLTGPVISIKPKYSTIMGIDQATYNAIKQAIDALEHNPKNFKELINIRDGLKQNIDLTKKGNAESQIIQARAAMMDYIQDLIQQHDPNISVREIFKKWAKNEENIELIEQRFKARVGSEDFRSGTKGEPEEAVFRNIFKDSATTEAFKEILSQEEFNKALADHLTVLRKNATHDGFFSSKNMTKNFVKGEYAMEEAFSNRPLEYKNIADALTLMRIFPDTTPANPSGTAKTAIQYFLTNIAHKPHSFVGEAIDFTKSKVAQEIQTRELNERLLGVKDRQKKFDALKSMIDKVSTKIETGAKSVLTPKGRGGIFGGSIPIMSDKQFEEIQDRLNELSRDPEKLVDHIGDSTSSLYNAAPNVTQNINTGIMTSIAFLSSKLPQPPIQLPFSSPWKPSNQQKAQFSQYYKAIDDPLNVFKQINHGTINNNTMEALQVVHPKLLEAMRMKVLEEMNVDRAKKLPYWQKLSLAKFLGQPLDGNMTTLGIVANQLALNAPSQSKQTSAAQAQKSTLGGLKQLNLSSRTATQSRRERDDT